MNALVIQFLVLAFTAALWWLARRDLTSKAADARAPAAEDWARLRVTVEQLMVELERRAVVAEQRISEAEQRLRLVEQRVQASFALAESAQGVSAAPVSDLSPALAVEIAAPAPERMAEAPPVPAALDALGNAFPAPALSTADRTAAPRLPAPAAVPPVAPVSAPPPLRLTPEEARYLPIHALADAGEADAAAIARQTGLPRGEIELVLSLRARRTG